MCNMKVLDFQKKPSESIFTVHKKSAPIGTLFLWVKMDSNHRSRETADLQSAPFGHSGIHPA